MHLRKIILSFSPLMDNTRWRYHLYFALRSFWMSVLRQTQNLDWGTPLNLFCSPFVSLAKCSSNHEATKVGNYLSDDERITIFIVLPEYHAENDKFTRCPCDDTTTYHTRIIFLPSAQPQQANTEHAL